MSRNPRSRAGVPTLAQAYRKLSLRKKLVVLISLVAALSTTVAMLASFVIELALFRDRLLDEYETTARMTANNLEAAVGFRDEFDANDLLSVLSQREFIETAAVYLNDGTTLAEFRRADLPPTLQVPLPTEKTRIGRNYIVVNEAIVLKESELGQLVFRAELGEQSRFISGRSWVFLLIIVPSLAMAVLLAKQLGSHLSRPIVDLARTAQRITEDHDFSKRQKRTTEDETGQLVDAFNEMIAEIESRSDALEKAKNAAEASNRAKDDFLSVISHELRTPLNPIIGFVEILLRNAKEAKDREQLGLVKRYSEHLQTLIDRVIDFSRFDRGDISLDYDAVDYQNLCQGVVDLLRQQADEKGIAMTCEHRYLSDAFRDSTTLSIDRVKLQQVVLNLVANSLKFTNSGSIAIKTLIGESQTHDANLHIEVQDTGIGIGPNDRAIIFEPFSQIDASLTREYSGMGLGLAITKKLVEAMGGQIDFESQEAVGSTFWFDIPADFSQEAEIDKDAPTQVESSTFKQPGKVLLVDDQLINLELGETLLTNSGQQVACARSGADAIELAQQHHFDLIILDIKMPKMNGYETAKRIRQNEQSDQRTPIVAMTAHVTARGEEQCIESGMDDFIPKPFNTQRLNHILKKWLKR